MKREKMSFFLSFKTLIVNKIFAIGNIFFALRVVICLDLIYLCLVIISEIV